MVSLHALAALGSLTSSGNALAQECTRTMHSRLWGHLTSESHTHTLNVQSPLPIERVRQMGIAALVCWLPWRLGEPL